MLRKKLAICLLMSTILLSACSPNSNTTSVKTTGQTAAATKTAGTTQSPQPKETATAAPSPAAVKTFEPAIVNNTKELQTAKIVWGWSDPTNTKYSTLLAKYKGYSFGDTSKKTIYLTFDEGYENGYTASILDTLKANNVKAAFFVTAPYVTGSFNGVKDIELLKRMMNEGHLICNHSVQHKSMPGFTDESSFGKELTGVENAVESTPGLKMSKYFRPPMGEFSELSLYYTQMLGYKTILFSLAHNDYTPGNQPDPETAKNKLLKGTRPGMICLLHAVSKTNAEILDSLIKEWKNQGYEFKTLNELP